MENDLISRSALKKDLLERSFFPAIVKAALEKAPAVDAVEVTRCRDCKHGIPFYDCAVECRLEETEYAVIREDFDFCSYGKRRSDDG